MELLIQIAYFTLLLSPFIVGMLSHDRSVRNPPVNMDRYVTAYGTVNYIDTSMFNEGDDFTTTTTSST